MSVVGKPVPHESAELHTTGAALYTDDLLPRVRNVLHAWPVQSQLAHAKVVALKTEAAYQVDGVVKVLCRDDVPGHGNTGPATPDEDLFPETVSFHGQALAWVLAETERAAREGAGRVEVVTEPMDAVLTMADAAQAGQYLTEPLSITCGDAAAALTRADHNLSGVLEIGGQEHFYLETQAALAYTDEGGHMLVHSSTQHPSETQAIVARVLGVDKSRVICQSLRMGGAFGGKETQANGPAAIAALGAHCTGRPTRVRFDRKLDMQLTGKRHPFSATFEVGFSDDGSIEALVVNLLSDGGYSLDLSRPIMWRALFHIDNCYRIPNLSATGRVLKTNKPSNTAFRGFGGPQGMVVIEEIMARIAQTLRLAPEDVRQKNFYRVGDRTPYGQEVSQADRVPRIWQALLESSDFIQRSQQIAAHNRSDAHAKRGIAITPVKFGISFTTSFFNQAGALVLMYQDGSVQLNHGGTEMGQGLFTKMQQVAAHTLGVALDRVSLMPTRTDKVPNTSATAASSGSDLNGAAVQNACETLRERLRPIAARMLAVAADSLVFADGVVSCDVDTDKQLPMAQLVRQAYLDRVQLSATGYYRTPDIHFDEASARGKPFHYFAYGAAVSEVVVDGFTGQYELLRVDILHDVGNSLSPLIDRGQIEGGFVQGVGWLTREELVVSQDGRLLTDGASTYKLPSVGDCPADFRVATLPRAAQPGVIHGSKAVGEPPLMLAISVREALRAAVSAFGDGVACTELGCPATPEAVYWAVVAAKNG